MSPQIINRSLRQDMPPLRSGISDDNKIYIIEVVSTCNAVSKNDDTSQSVRQEEK
jgi:hypothetical protein